MATVDEYRRQKLLAEKLRKQEAAYGGMGGYDPVNVTRGSGGGAGVYQQPDIIQANPWGAIGQVAGGWLGGKAADKAAQTETDAMAARAAAMDEILGEEGTIDPQKAIRLQELGIDVNPADFMVKPKTASPGAVIQAVQAGLPPDIVAKIGRGEDLTPDEIKAVQAAQQSKYDRELADKIRLKQTAAPSTASTKPLTPEQQKGALTAQWLAATDPAEKQRLKAELDSLTSLTASAKPMSAHEMKAFDAAATRKAAADGALTALDNLEVQFSKEGADSLYSLDQIAANALIDISSGSEGMLAGALNTLGRGISNETTAAVQSLTTEAVVGEMSKLGGNDSQQELTKMRQMYPDGIMPRESALELTRNLKVWRQITSLANQLEMDARANGTFYSAGGERGFHKKAKEMLGVDYTTNYTKNKIPEVVKAKRGGTAPAASTEAAKATGAGIQDVPVPGYEDIWAKMTPEEKAEARK